VIGCAEEREARASQSSRLFISFINGPTAVSSTKKRFTAGEGRQRALRRFKRAWIDERDEGKRGDACTKLGGPGEGIGLR